MAPPRTLTHSCKPGWIGPSKWKRESGQSDLDLRSPSHFSLGFNGSVPAKVEWSQLQARDREEGPNMEFVSLEGPGPGECRPAPLTPSFCKPEHHPPPQGPRFPP